MATDKTTDLLRQRNALIELGDEIMSSLHAHRLRGEQINSQIVIDQMQHLYDLVQEGLGRPAHFHGHDEA